nr:hypothetical protein [uncultured Blautia sp.]
METLIEYLYLIVKEDLITGKQAKRGQLILRWEPLDVGGLYMHLYGKSGAYRVLECVSAEEVEL